MAPEPITLGTMTFDRTSVPPMWELTLIGTDAPQHPKPGVVSDRWNPVPSTLTIRIPIPAGFSVVNPAGGVYTAEDLTARVVDFVNVTYVNDRPFVRPTPKPAPALSEHRESRRRDSLGGIFDV